MNVKVLNKYYHQRTARECLALLIAASVRGDVLAKEGEAAGSVGRTRACSLHHETQGHGRVRDGAYPNVRNNGGL
jgi:hypothetical protein